ncbi:hypothetical protein BASA82_000197 [Batrachochytrium salamandrivorans]|nr:hypothetical protein BASA82_000197 [Batrachochytrium salamandrivorans]
MSQGIGTFHNADNTFCRVLENGISKIPYCPSWDRKSVYARFHRGLGHLKFDSIIDLRSSPFERWGMDFVQDLPRTKSGNQHIITAIDYATRWVVAKAVPNRDSVTVASFLYELMMNYGSPFELFHRIEEVRYL